MTSKGRSRALRIVLVVFVLLLVAAVALPRLAAPLVRDRIEAALSERAGGEAEIASLTLTWAGVAELEGLVVRNAQGEQIAAVREVHADLELLKLLFGTIQADVRVDDPELVVHQRADGSWSFEDWLETEDPSSDEERDGERGASSLPRLDLTLTGGRVRIVGNQGTTSVDGLGLTANVGRATPSDKDTAELRCSVTGPAGETGEVVARAAYAVAGSAWQDMDLDAFVALDRVALSLLDPWMSGEARGREHAGVLSAKIEADAAGGSWKAFLGLGVDDLRVAIPREGEAELLLEDPHAGAELVLELPPASPRRLQLGGEIASRFLAGTLAGTVHDPAAALARDGSAGARIESLTASLRYRPDELGALLAPLLPVPLTRRASGQAEERLELDYSGPLDSFDLGALLANGTGSADVGLGRVATTWLDAEGDLGLRFGADGTEWTAALDANGGSLSLSGRLDREALAAFGDPGGRATTTLLLDAVDVGATARLAPLLELVHPAFAGLESLEASQVSGSIRCGLDLAYTGPLALSEDGSLETSGIEGRGSLAVTGARLTGSPALSQMLAYLGVDPNEEIRMRPIEFTIADGRLTYAKDWTWTIKDVETTFTGSVGLDQTLDLAWNVPVTDAVVAEYSFLESLRGTRIELPITGTVKSPRLDWRGSISALAKDFARGLAGDLGVEDLDKEKLGDLLGDVVRGENAETGETAQSLFDEADRLWKDDRRAEAAAIYRRIREEFKLSLVYALNRDKIKKRGDWKEE